MIEAQGLKIAQARRRLTAATTVTDTPPVPPASLTVVDAAVANLPTETLPQQPTHTTAPTVPLPQDTLPPAAYTRTVKAEQAPAAHDLPPARPVAAPGTPPPAQRGRERTGPGPLRTSVQARRVAQQLREVYAQRAKF